MYIPTKITETEPKVTVIIPNYNHGIYIKKSIESIKNQSYKNLEVFVVDDGSTDPKSIECFQEFLWDDSDSRFNFEMIPKNIGKWAILNYAITKSNSQLIMVHDADDVAHHRKVECQVRAMLETNCVHNLAGFVHCYSEEELDKVNQIQVPDQLPILSAEEVYRNCVTARNTPGINHYVASKKEVAGGPCMYRKEIWTLGLRYQPSKYGLRVQIGEDSDFNTRATMLLQNTTVVDYPLYGYRRNSSIVYDTNL